MSTFGGFFEEVVDFRADRFSAARGKPQEPLYLLSHIHADHIQGLSSKSFSKGTIYCTDLTRKLLFGLESHLDRVKYNYKLSGRTRPYAKLRNDAFTFRVLDYDTPTWIRKSFNRFDYRLTLIDANHCPGSCMFLIETFPKDNDFDLINAVLYTGDMRADPNWLASIARKPFLVPYLASNTSSLARKLDNIYLDTTAALCRRDALPRTDAIQRTLALMLEYPSYTKFFVNLWTPGYEDFAEALHAFFSSPIHVDRYKYSQFVHIYGQARCQTMFTRDSTATRFHACDLHFKCDEVWSKGRGCYAFPLEQQAQMAHRDARDSKKKLNAGCGCAYGSATCAGESCEAGPDPSEGLVVYVNPAEPFPPKRWAKYEAEMKRKIIAGRSAGNCPQNLVRLDLLAQSLNKAQILPLSRHSCLPELRLFVASFKPRCLFPCTIYDQQNHVDYLVLPRLFKRCVVEEAYSTILERAKLFVKQECALRGLPLPAHIDQVAVDNLSDTVPITFGHDISHAGLVNFAGPDYFEHQILELLSGDLFDSDLKAPIMDDTESPFDLDGDKDAVQIARPQRQLLEPPPSACSRPTPSNPPKPPTIQSSLKAKRKTEEAPASQKKLKAETDHWQRYTQQYADIAASVNAHRPFKIDWNVK